MKHSRWTGIAEAHQMGLVDHVYLIHQLMSRVRKLAEEIAALSLVAVRAAKRALNVAISYSLDVGLYRESATSNFYRDKAGSFEE